MLSQHQLIQRLRGACSQRRLFSGERGAIATSLIEIGVAMLAVAILTAGALTSFIGFIARTSDTAARATLSDATTIADSVYNHLRVGGKRCYGTTTCGSTTDAQMADALQDESGGELAFAAWDGNFPATGTVYVQVAQPANGIALPGNSTTIGSSGTIGTAAGDWIILAVKSDSGASFCVLKVTRSAQNQHEGVGYMSVDSDATATAKTAAHCGGHAANASGKAKAAGGQICIYGPEGARATEVTTDATNCVTRRTFTEPISLTTHTTASDTALNSANW